MGNKGRGKSLNLIRVEKESLMEQCIKHNNITYGALSAAVKELWREITNKINQSGHNKRSIAQVKKK